MMNQPNEWSLPFRYAVGAGIVLALASLVVFAREAVQALVIAGFVAYLINPLVNLLMLRTRMSRTLAVNIVYFSALIFLVGIPSALTPIFFDEIKIVAEDLLDLSNELGNTLSYPIQVGGMVFHFEQLGEGLASLQDTVLTPLPEVALSLLESTSISVLWSLVIIVSVHLFMTEWPKIREGMIHSVPPAFQEEIRELYQRIRRVWMAYLRGQIVLMFVVGIVFTLAWVILGIPGALVLGVVAGFFTLVPDVGPFLAAMLAVGVALLEGSSWIPVSKPVVALIVLIVYLVLINLKNFLLRPYIMGRSLQMNEALIFIAILIATILGGIMGALLVVPVLASAAVIGEYLRRRLLGLAPFEDGESTPFVPESRTAAPAAREAKQSEEQDPAS
jgi:predicted PurR-regulated permease PerM